MNLISLGRFTQDIITDLRVRSRAAKEAGENWYPIRRLEMQARRNWLAALRSCDYLTQAKAEVAYLREHGPASLLSATENGGYRSHLTSGILKLDIAIADAGGLHAQADAKHTGSLLKTATYKTLDSFLDALDADLNRRIRRRDQRLKGEWTNRVNMWRRQQELGFGNITNELITGPMLGYTTTGQQTFGQGIWRGNAPLSRKLLRITKQYENPRNLHDAEAEILLAQPWSIHARSYPRGDYYIFVKDAVNEYGRACVMAPSRAPQYAKIAQHMTECHNLVHECGGMEKVKEALAGAGLLTPAPPLPN